MDALTRRRFLLASGVAGGAAIVAGGAAMGLAELLSTAPDPATGAKPDENLRPLVLVTLYGGNDGLNTVIPYNDAAYQSARPELAYSPSQVLHLDDALGLNPAMTGLHKLWDEKQLAIVLGVGYPKPNLSHFRSMDIWQTASPDKVINSGWLGRWLDSAGGGPETAVSFEPVLPPLLVGETRTGACVDIDGVRLPDGISAAMVAALGSTTPGAEMLARAATSYADLVEIDKFMQTSVAPSSPAEDDDQSDTLATATGGGNFLAAQLNVVARCIEAGVPTRVYSVSLGGFDTHAQERGMQERLLKQLDVALSGFAAKVAQNDLGKRTTVVVYSEFGRRVRANASDGTDHGTAGPVFVLGPQVRGGFHGEQPSLTDLDRGGDLKMTTDFRDVFGTVLTSLLGAEPARYLEGYQVRELPLFRAQ
jgi:uncharacterized protein (DUF1501 family)